MRIDAITVGERRREDMGDLDGLAASIKRVGLIHPVVVDEAGSLVAGGRRLEACRRLGLTDIPARSMGELTVAERREIELEENLHRKDLTQLERDKKLVELMETAAEVLREQAEDGDVVFTESVKTTSTASGRAENAIKRDALQKVSERIGVPVMTLWEAREHVEAKAAHPDLADQPKTVAIKEARRRKRPAKSVSPPRSRSARQPSRPTARPGMRGTPVGLWLKGLKDFQARAKAMGGQAGLLTALAAWPHGECVSLGRELQALSAELDEMARAVIQGKDTTNDRAS